jgi:transcriptional regulator with XRE-family HTH domain
MKRNEMQQPSSAFQSKVTGTVNEIIRNARGSLTQAEFVDLLKDHHGIKTSQGLISKYESGNANPPSKIINKCIEIIHGKNANEDVSLTALEIRMRKVLRGPAQAGARKAFAVILDSLS